MKTIVFLSAMGLDVGLGMAKALSRHYDVRYIKLRTGEISDWGISDFDQLVTRADALPQLAPMSELFPLDKMWMVRHKRHSVINAIQVDLAVLRMIREIAPNAILYDSGAFSCMITRLLQRKRVLALVHDPFKHSGENGLLSRIAHWQLIKLAQRHVIFNVAQKDAFLRVWHLNSQDVGVSFLSQYDYIRIFDKKPMKKMTHGTFNIFFWGRISRYKGIENLLKAMQQIANGGREDICCKIMGGGEYDFDIDKYKDLKNTLIVHRRISSFELAENLRDADVVVCPYRDATQSGVVMTAFAMNVPVLATEVGGLPEMLCNGECGMLIPPSDCDALAGAITRLADHPELLQTYKDKIRSHYFGQGDRSWNVAVEAIEEQIEKV